MSSELNRRIWARRGIEGLTSLLDLGFVPAAHHRLLIEKLEAVERGETTRLMVFMPPGSAKSTYASILFPAWYLGRNPDKHVLASSHTTELAERFGRRVRNIIAEPDYGRVFATRLAADSQAAGRWATQQGGEYYAAGVGSAILGFRADLGLIDDPVAGREAADSEREREKIWEWYKSDFYTRLKPGAAIVLIMQRWREDDLAGRLIEEAERGGEQWEVLRLPMEAEEDDALGREPGEPLWPEWFTSDMREQARRDPRNWLALYQQRPRAESGGELKREWLNYWKRQPSGGNRYILVDPAGERKPGQAGGKDNTAMGVIELGMDGNYYLIDGYRDRLNLTERADILFRWHREYRPLGVGYERYGMQSDIAHLKDRMERENYRFHIIELGGSLKKEDRIRRLIPIAEHNRLWLPQTLHRTLSTGKTVNIIERFVEEEWLPFPVGQLDDFLDMLSRIADPDLKLVWPREGKPKAKPQPTQNLGNSGWMIA